MFRTTRAVWVCALAALAAGCFQEKRAYTINHDGSGKVDYSIRQPQPPQGGRGPALQPAEFARKEAGLILARSRGVDAWKDVSYEIDAEGMFVFQGTAYFPDLNKLDIMGSARNKMAAHWQREAAGAEAVALSVSLDAQTLPRLTPATTDEEIERRVVAAKTQFRQQLQALEQFLPKYRVEWTFVVPGEVSRVVDFERPAGQPNLLRLLYDGPKMLAALKALADDDAYWREQAKAGVNPRQGPDMAVINEKLFGTRANASAEVTPGAQPLFNYAAESAAARQLEPAMREKLGLPAR